MAAKEIAVKKYVVKLSADERARLDSVITTFTLHSLAPRIMAVHATAKELNSQCWGPFPSPTGLSAYAAAGAILSAMRCSDPSEKMPVSEAVGLGRLWRPGGGRSKEICSRRTRGRIHLQRDESSHQA